MIKNKTLALFDFDGTITNRDTFLEFIKFTHGTFRFYAGLWLMSPMLVLYLAKIMKNTTAKMMVIRYFFKGWEQSKLETLGKEFCEKKLQSFIRPKAVEKIKSHLANGDRVIMVTASCKEWVQGWATQMGIELLSTELEAINGIITGKLATPNCYGHEKVFRIESVLDPKDYHEIYAYGDSNGDKEMLALAQHSHYKPFRD